MYDDITTKYDDMTPDYNNITPEYDGLTQVLYNPERKKEEQNT